MEGESICEKCGVGFSWVRAKNAPSPRFCSMKCRGHTGFKPGGIFRTSEETAEEKLSRLRRNLQKNVITQEGCWDWKGGIENTGYARLSIRDVPCRHAHVASYLLRNGEIPEGLQVNHLCHNRKCCNPDHLYLGTQADNMRDKVQANRQAKGAKNGNAKLTENGVRKIKELLKNGEKTSVIATMFLVTPEQICNINSGKQWNHIKE